MKKTSALLLVVSFIVLFVTLACDTGSGGESEDGSNDEIQFTEGWWKYQTDISGTHATYIEYDSEKVILRAGTDTEEYLSTYLEAKADSLSFEFLKENSTSSSTFEHISDYSVLPTWVDDSTELRRDPTLYGIWHPLSGSNNYGSMSTLEFYRDQTAPVISIYEDPTKPDTCSLFQYKDWGTYRSSDGSKFLVLSSQNIVYSNDEHSRQYWDDFKYELASGVLTLTDIDKVFQLGPVSKWVKNN